MIKLKKIPDAEFEVMKIVWANEPPITTNIIMAQLGDAKGWKVPTAISLLLRLVERGYLRTEKNGKERSYYPIVGEEEYLKFETENFLKMYHGNSFASFANSLTGGKKFDENDIKELMNWAKEREV